MIGLAGVITIGDAVRMAARAARPSGRPGLLRVISGAGSARRSDIASLSRNSPLSSLTTLPPEPPVPPTPPKRPIAGQNGQLLVPPMVKELRPEPQIVSEPSLDELMNAVLSPALAELGASARWGEELPLHFSVIAPRLFRGIIGSMAGKPRRTGQLDIPALMAILAARKIVRRLPRLHRSGLPGKLIVYCDLGIAMRPMQKDMADFFERCRRLLGSERVERRYISETGALENASKIERDATVVIISDLQAFSLQFSYGCTPAHEWLKLARALERARARCIVLSPGTPAGQVPPPAYPALFEPRRPLVGRVVPWSRRLDARDVRSYATGSVAAKWQPVDRRPAQAGRLTETARLLRLASLVHDLDRFTLRTLQMALSAPREVAERYGITDEDIRSCGGASLASVPRDAEIGAYHEYAVWVSAYLTQRGNVGLFSSAMADWRARPRLDQSVLPDGWTETLALAQSAIRKSRAGRPNAILLGDRFAWSLSRDRADSAVAEKDRVAILHLANELRNNPSHRSLVDKVFGDRLTSSRVKPASESRHASVLCVKKSGDEIIIDLDRSDFPVRISLQNGLDLSDSYITLWNSGRGGKAEHTSALWPLPKVINKSKLGLARLPSTVVLALGSQMHYRNLDSSLSDMKPLFVRRLDGWGGGLRFEGAAIVANDTRYDVLGLGEASAIEPVETVENAGRKLLDDDASDELGRLLSGRDGPRRIWFNSEAGLLTESLGTDRSTRRTISLPRRNDWRVPTSGVSGGGTILLRSPATAVVISSRDLHAKVDIWRLSSKTKAGSASIEGHFGVSLLAASEAGAIMQVEGDRKETRLALIPPWPERGDAPSALIGRITSAVDEIALSDTGLLAVRSGSELRLYEPMSVLGDARDDLGSKLDPGASPASNSDAAPKFISSVDRTWQSTPDFSAFLIEGLTLSTRENMDTAKRFAEKGAFTLTVAQLRSGLEASEVDASGILNILQRNIAGVAADLARGFNANFNLPRSGLKPLFLALLDGGPYEIVELLLDNKAEVNATDALNRSALYMACYRKDEGRAATLLLDRGADASINGEAPLKHQRLGPLPAALGAGDKENHFPRALIDRLIAAGADPLVMSGYQLTTLASAILRNDMEIFESILALDTRVNGVEDGWRPLRVAAYTGNAVILERLLASGADPQLPGPVDEDPLLEAVNRGHFECVEILLGRVNLLGKPDHRRSLLSALYTPYSGIGVTSEQIAKSAEAFARHGIRPTEIVSALLAGLQRYGPDRIKNDDDNSPFSRAVAVLRGYNAAGAPVRAIELLASEDNVPPAASAGRIVQAIGDLNVREYLDLTAAGEGGQQLVHLLACYWNAGRSAPSLNPFKLLRERGVDIASGDNFGSNALHYAAWAGNSETHAALLDVNLALLDQPRQDAVTPRQLFADFETGSKIGAARRGRRIATNIVEPPTMGEMQLLTLLPQATAWQDIPESAVRRLARGGDGVPIPLPRTVEYWTLSVCRKARLPYKDKWLREAWWRRTDGVIGLSSSVVDDDDKKVFDISGQSTWIHEMNAKTPLQITGEADALAYLKFFCHATHGDDGPFSICDTPETLARHIDLQPNEALPISFVVPHVEKESVEEVGEELSASNASGRRSRTVARRTWRLHVNIRYSSAIFTSVLVIRPTGMVEMLSDDPVHNLPQNYARHKRDGDIFFYESHPPG